MSSSSPRRFLRETLAKSSPSAIQSSQNLQPESGIVVILAALLCAVLCIVGLGLVAWCAWIRRNLASSLTQHPPSPPNKGIDKKILKSIPNLSFKQASKERGGKLSSDCSICLAEFTDEDKIRVLPQCCHGFHVECIDTWFRSHLTCPSCRTILVGSGKGKRTGKVAGTCQSCGASEEVNDTTPAAVPETLVVVLVENGKEKGPESSSEGSTIKGKENRS